MNAPSPLLHMFRPEHHGIDPSEVERPQAANIAWKIAGAVVSGSIGAGSLYGSGYMIHNGELGPREAVGLAFGTAFTLASIYFARDAVEDLPDPE